MLNNVTAWLEQTAEKYPEKTAFSDERKSVTYRELSAQAKAAAVQIIRLGIFKKPVAVFLPKGVDTIISFMAAAYSGNFYSPIDVEMPKKRVQKILEVLEPETVITSSDLAGIFRSYGYEKNVIIFEEAVQGETPEKQIAAVQSKCIDTDILYVLFTSGSTGTPKGVAISHRSVFDYIDWVTDCFQITEEDSFGNQAPFYFDNSVLDIYSTIKTGAACHIIPKRLFSQPVRLLEFLKERQISTIFWVPSAMILVSRLKALRNVDLSGSLKRILFAGEVMPNKHLNIWRTYLPDALYANLYGPTEITVDCTCYVVDREFPDDEPLPIGFPIPNTDVIVLNEKDCLVTGDQSGELCVRGTSLALGYYNNPEKTRESFVQNPLNPHVPELIYRTGDIVRYNERGELIYLARKDYQVKHLGHRIELGEIETAVSSVEGVELCCCLYDDEHQKIVLYLDKPLEKAYIKEKISQLLPEYMLPNKIECLDGFPLNANGKIDRAALKALLEKKETH